MRLTGSRTYYRPTPPKMPPGLVELMEGLTKEVLKHNPTDIYGFCAGHVEQLLEKRDGPSRKKLLSVEDKIVRAQQKVRQRAEKRRQEYDKNLMLSQEHSDDVMNVNDELTLQVSQLISTSESRNIVTASDEDNTKSRHDENIQTNALKAPVHQEHALDNSSEVEISHESGTLDNSDKKDESDIVPSKEGNYTSTVTTEANDAQSRNKTNENDMSLTKIADTATNDNPDNNFETTDPNLGIAADIGSDTSTTDGQSNVNSEVCIIEEDNAKTDEQVLDAVDSTNSTVGSDENVPKDNEKFNDAVIDTENPSLNNQDIKNILEAHNNDDNINSTKTNSSNSVDANDSAQNQSDSHVIGVDMNKDDQNHDSNDGIVNAEEIPPPTNIENESTVIINVHTVNEQRENSSNATQELSIAKDSVDTQNDDNTELQSDTATSGLSVHSSNDQHIDNTENKQLKINEEANEELKEATETSILESVDAKEKLKQSINVESATPFASPQTGVDKDNPTLITENTENNASEDNEVKIATSSNNITDKRPAEDMPPSQVDKENTVLDKVTSDNEDVYDYTPNDAQNNSTDSIINFSSANTHNTEMHLEGTNQSATSDNMNENTQNDNHDPGNMDLETAAITIQKVFRTFLFKSRGSTFEDTGNDEGNFLDEDDKNKEECDFPIISALNIDRRAHGITRMDTVLQTVNEEKSLSLSDDSSTLSSAATIIQAHVRGFLVRNKLNSYKTSTSTNSLAASNSNEPSVTSLEVDNEQNKNKTILNIHIVPEGENYLSRDESLITSMELSLDSSPPSSINLHPLGYDKSERRKQLKREDAIQSISPPSNNSGKLSEDVDSVKELSLNDHDIVAGRLVGDNNSIKDDLVNEHGNRMLIENSSIETALNVYEGDANNVRNKLGNSETPLQHKGKSIIKMSSDEMDVVTPFISNEESTLIHSGEFHDAVLPTRVSRSDTSVVSGE